MKSILKKHLSIKVIFFKHIICFYLCSGVRHHMFGSKEITW